MVQRGDGATAAAKQAALGKPAPAREQHGPASTTDSLPPQDHQTLAPWDLLGWAGRSSRKGQPWHYDYGFVFRAVWRAPRHRRRVETPPIRRIRDATAPVSGQSRRSIPTIDAAAGRRYNDADQARVCLPSKPARPV